MKRTIAAMIISTLFSLTLAACGGTSQNSSNSASDTSNAELSHKTNAIMEIAQSTGNTNLDPHKEYFG